MKKKTTEALPLSTKGEIGFSNLEEFALRIQGWLQGLLEEEVSSYFGRGKHERIGEENRSSALHRQKSRPGYRNGYGKPRRLTTSIGTVEVRHPRVRGLMEGEDFESKVLPLFASRTSKVDAVLLELYLHGLSLGDFDLALRGLLGDKAPISSSTLARLKESWLEEFKSWKAQSLKSCQVVYVWVDGIYVKAGLEGEKSCLLVALAGLSDGSKVFIAIESGYRESKESWAALLRDLKQRGLQSPRLVIGDGALGIWSALSEIFPLSQQQRCWNHRKINILNQIPDKAQPQATQLLKAVTAADSQIQTADHRTEVLSQTPAPSPSTRCLQRS